MTAGLISLTRSGGPVQAGQTQGKAGMIETNKVSHVTKTNPICTLSVEQNNQVQNKLVLFQKKTKMSDTYRRALLGILK